ncbi:hypothetical protein LTR27_009466 [Elasticomyces elasticus]|nr:hypothetical protein LTR27_009466 [Elasticomyces elasticus]
MTRCSALETSSHFKYSPVEHQGAIRLFTFLESADDEIVISLDEYAFETQPYTAVSYEWGKEEALRVIIIVPPSRPSALMRTSVMPIRRNCWVALNQLRQRDTGQHYWLDFISIDQENDEEKSAEVQRMASIYEQAHTTALCLGEHDEASQLVFGLLRWHERRAMSEAKNTSVDQYESFTYTRSKYDPAIWAFHGRSYFSRLWIVQEILLSKNIHVYCGDDRVPWKLFEAVTRRKTAFWSAATTCSDSFLDQIFMLRDRFTNSQGQGTTLDQLLAGCATRRCSDPRDKVFALLGLIARDHRGDIKPDYSMSQRALSLTAVRHCVSIVQDREWHSAIRLLVRALQSDENDPMLVMMAKNTVDRVRRVTSAVLQRLEETAWDKSIHAHLLFMGHIERNFGVREVPPEESSERAFTTRKLITTGAQALTRPSEASIWQTRSTISLTRSRMLSDDDVLLARAQIGRLYRALVICCRPQGSLDDDGTFIHSDSLIDRSDRASKEDAMVYVDAEDVFTYILRQEGKYRIEPAIVHLLTNDFASFRRQSRRMLLCTHF